ncbi:S-adenosyl-L-methionine-dependent methyltransferase [Cerioporus squamosus]|nr:S-adenosyl-L-methionine-dependent methyltransferase [Cerioporus squamosus]
MPCLRAPAKPQDHIYSSAEESPLCSSDDYVDTSSDGRSASPAPSMYSFSSSVDGRMMTGDSDGSSLYQDNEEHRRLDLQHQIITLALGSLYPAPNLVRRALAPRPGKTPAVLDVGTGSGSWAIDMAKQFPHCSVVGVDLAPPRVDGDLPPNCRFEIDDANLGFSHYRESFDVIHARSVSAGIRDFPQLLEELAQALRPGGVVLLGDGEMQLYDEWQEPLAYSEQGSPDHSWVHSIFFAGYNAMKTRGGSVFIPIGPWRYADQRELVLAEMLREDCLRYIAGLGPYLLSEGYLPESVEMMQREAATELRELRVRLHSRWSFAWAVKK